MTSIFAHSENARDKIVEHCRPSFDKTLSNFFALDHEAQKLFVEEVNRIMDRTVLIYADKK